MTEIEKDIRSNVGRAPEPAKYNNAFDIDEKVWLQNPRTGWFAWRMCVVAKRYNEGWEYQVKGLEEGGGVLYNQGEWILEEKLKDG